MKKLLFFVLISFIISGVFAQKAAVVSAYNYLNKGKLDKAKSYIDEAANHESTMAEAKTWFYRGNIYLTIAASSDSVISALDPDALGVAYESYLKTKEFDKKKEYEADLVDRFQALSENYYNKGVKSYNFKDYSGAVTNFSKSFNISKNNGRIDTLAIQNVAFCAEMADNKTLARDTYLDMITLNIINPNVYSSLANVYKDLKDFDNAKKIVKEGRTRFPNDLNIIISEANIYLATEDKDKAMETLNLALNLDKSNPSIYFAIGALHDQMGNFEQAEKMYNDAIALKPDYFEAIYNLGALYVNKAAQILEVANKLPLEETTKYEGMKKEADQFLDKSLPYLESASQLDPNDRNTLLSLKEIYTRLNMMEKLKAVNEKLQ